MDSGFKCLMVRQGDGKAVSRSVETKKIDELPNGDVTIKVQYSSLNYKDALAATGHPGVVANLPHIPGIDAAGVVVASQDPYFKSGDEVMVFDAKFGTKHFGGYSQFVRVPVEWVYAIPKNLTPRTAMIYGTAGFTAAQSIDQLERHGITPDQGDVLVTGATGGVGTFAVKMLAKIGYRVVAVTGKPDGEGGLLANGAAEVISREDVDDSSRSPLLTARWSAAVDTVGGNTLATILRATKEHGCVTACGMVAGAELAMTVYPFILRGVALQGIDSANITHRERTRIWERVSSEFLVSGLEAITTETRLNELNRFVDSILAGRITGRVIVNLQD